MTWKEEFEQNTTNNILEEFKKSLFDKFLNINKVNGGDLRITFNLDENIETGVLLSKEMLSVSKIGELSWYIKKLLANYIEEEIIKKFFNCETYSGHIVSTLAPEDRNITIIHPERYSEFLRNQ